MSKLPPKNWDAQDVLKRPFLSVLEFSHLTGYSKPHINKAINSRQIAAVKLGEAWRIPASEFRRLEKEAYAHRQLDK